MNTHGWKCAAIGVVLMSIGGCGLRNVVTDQAQIDSMTFCPTSSMAVGKGESWGRRDIQSDSGRDVDWSHFSLGEFACKTQDEWLCQARSGKLGCNRNDPLGVDQAAKAAANAKPNAADLQRFRNETVSEMMMQSDRLCDRHLASIFGTQAYVGLSTDIAGSLLSGGAAIATGIPARNLSAAAAMVGATKSHISADIYQGKVATAINLIIRKERNALRTVLRSNQSCSPSTYTASQAVQDALNYHNMCSFEYGLSELVREASDTSPLRAPLAASFLARTESELQVLQEKLANFKGDDSEKAELKGQINRKLGQVELYRAFGVSESALPVSSSGSTGVATKTTVVTANSNGTTTTGATASTSPKSDDEMLVAQRSCDKL
jgi:hypothetical protein